MKKKFKKKIIEKEFSQLEGRELSKKLIYLISNKNYTSLKAILPFLEKIDLENKYSQFLWKLIEKDDLKLYFILENILSEKHKETAFKYSLAARSNNLVNYFLDNIDKIPKEYIDTEASIMVHGQNLNYLKKIGNVTNLDALDNRALYTALKYTQIPKYKKTNKEILNYLLKRKEVVKTLKKNDKKLYEELIIPTKVIDF